MKQTDYICTLPWEQRRMIRVEVTRALSEIIPERSLREYVTEAMAGRVCDLAETVDLRSMGF